MFTNLRNKLTVLYAGLFSGALVLLACLVYFGISTNAARTVRDELTESGAVFERIWALRAKQMQDSASILSRDFGFREAVATGDEATTDSALDNLRERLGLASAFLITVDGRAIGARGVLDDQSTDILWNSLNNDVTSGTVMLDGAPYQITAAPILAPVLTGWVVFADKLDRAELASLEELSSIPIGAELFRQDETGDWVAVQASDSARQVEARHKFIVESLAAPRPTPRKLNGPDGEAIALAKTLPSLDGARPVALLLRYPLALAMAPYRPLLIGIFVLGVIGLILLTLGSFALARNLTRPLSALADAAARVARGETVNVAIEGADEIGALAKSFNAMSVVIKERENEITHLAMHDIETKLPNRVALERTIDAMIAGQKESLVVVAALGIERFRYLRSAIGYPTTAALIEAIAARIESKREHCRAARLASDVLGLTFTCRDSDEARDAARTLLAALDQPFSIGADTIDVNFTIGLAVFGAHGAVASELIERASIALDQARAQHDGVAMFDQVAYGDPSGNLSLMSEMLRSLTNDEMRLYYQPKLDLRTRRVTSAEALVRWFHGKRGFIAPDDFILMAEETGAIRPLTEWVLARAIEDQRSLAARGQDIPISVNISGRLLNDQEFADAALEQIGRTKAKLVFEITETAVMENPEMALEVITRFADAGIDISIDDYGSGFSSLTYLRRIPARELKIDKSFVLGLREGQRDALLVKSTIDLAHSLGLRVTAEGVETSDALALLGAMSCDSAQGYFIGRAEPLADLQELLAEIDPGRVSKLSA